MDEVIMIGCDVHERTMLLKAAVGREEPVRRTFRNTTIARRAMIRWLEARAQKAGGARVAFVYEASCLGFGLHDELTAAGIECSVLAPTRIERSPKHVRSKTDERDAQRLLDLLRGHVLAGTPLPAVWVPAPPIRDDREVVRSRLDVREKVTRVKTQIRMLLKRQRGAAPGDGVRPWSLAYRAWLRGLVCAGGPLPVGTQAALGSLLRQVLFLEDEMATLDEAVAWLSAEPRYAKAVQAMCRFKGVQVLTAMVFLTELGDLSRFRNRRQVGAYLGLVPSSQESGEQSDRKGHITHQGPARVRKVLCQAVWSRLRCDESAQAIHARIAAGKKQRRKIATVALMRRMAIRLWHIGVAAQRGGGSAAGPPQGMAA